MFHQTINDSQLVRVHRVRQRKGSEGEPLDLIMISFTGLYTAISFVYKMLLTLSVSRVVVSPLL